MSHFQEAKMWLVQTLHLAKDALHIYVALLVFFGACALFRWKAWQWKPWLCVLAAALAGEALDIRDSLVFDTGVDLGGSFKDMWNTMLVPTLLVLLARSSKVFVRPEAEPGESDPG